MSDVRCKVIPIDNDRIVKLGRSTGGALQVIFESSGISTERCSVTHTHCKCGKGRTKVHFGLSDEAMYALFMLYDDLRKKENKSLATPETGQAEVPE